MKRRYYYALIGLVFGVMDWFYPGWLSCGFGPNLGENPFMVIGGSAIAAFVWWLLKNKKRQDRNSA
ncbi:MAG: hypothetical protein WCY93_03415 [Anaerolineaceae bacterium]